MRRPPDDFADVKESLIDDGRSKLITSHGQIFVHDLKVSHLIGEMSLNATLLRAPYVLPPELKALGGRFRRERISKDSAIFNGPALGWASAVDDPRLGQNAVELITGTFFDRLASDYFAAVDTRRDGSHTVIDGRRLFIDRHGALRGFDVSWLFNGIGVSTIAITSDGMFILTEQSVRNVGEPGLLAPSGSGTLEPKDFGNRLTLSVAELAISGANRELQEEASIDPSDIESSYFLGFGRWLNKAACPEIFSATLLNIDSHELRKRKRRAEERVYVDGNFCVRPALAMKDWDASKPDLLLPALERGRISLPLGVVLALLAHEVRSRPSPLAVKLQNRFNESQTEN